MPFQYDPEFFKVIRSLGPLLSGGQELTADTVISGRKAREAQLAAYADQLPDQPDVEQTLYYTEAPDGHQIPILGLVKKEKRSTPGPAILHIHGGGMVMGTPQMTAKELARSVSETSVPMFSVDYRLAPEFKDTTLVSDCYAGLCWLQKNARDLNIDPARIAVYGQSAGGGLAAGVALMARDRGLQPPLAKQILIYPMLDDRNNTADDAIEPFAVWKTSYNVIGWTSLLGDKAGKPDGDVSPYAAPARAKSLKGLPPTYIDVGVLDIFRDEDITYATRLLAENIEVELHVYPGLPHAFEYMAPDIPATRGAYGNRSRAMQSF